MTILTGLFRVTQDADLRYTGQNEPVINLQLAYSYGTKKNDRGYLPSQFIEAGFWGKRAQALAEYLTKGTRIVAVITEVRIEQYQKGDGTPAYKLMGRVNELEFAGAPAERAERQQPAPAPAPRPARTAPSAQPDFDDEIPF